MVSVAVQQKQLYAAAVVVVKSRIHDDAWQGLHFKCFGVSCDEVLMLIRFFFSRFLRRRVPAVDSAGDDLGRVRVEPLRLLVRGAPAN